MKHAFTLIFTIQILILSFPTYSSDACIDIELINEKTLTSNDAYNLACCYALKRESKQSFRFLNLAVNKGFKSVSWMNNDSDLASLKFSKEWAIVIDKVKNNYADYLSLINKEVLTIYQNDQKDRGKSNINWAEVKQRDKQRREKLSIILKNNIEKKMHSDDYYHAALVYIHGETPSDFKISKELALKSLELKNPNAKWLSCAAEDKYLHSINKPQIWGTQFIRIDKNSPWTLEPFDTSIISDAERAECGIPSIQSLLVSLDEKNKKHNHKH